MIFILASVLELRGEDFYGVLEKRQSGSFLVFILQDDVFDEVPQFMRRVDGDVGSLGELQFLGDLVVGLVGPSRVVDDGSLLLVAESFKLDDGFLSGGVSSILIEDVSSGDNHPVIR